MSEEIKKIMITTRIPEPVKLTLKAISKETGINIERLMERIYGKIEMVLRKDRLRKKVLKRKLTGQKIRRSLRFFDQ